MVRIITSCIFCLCLFTVNGFAQQATNLTKEEAAIKKVIEEESRYFWGRDFARWKETYVNAPYVVWTVSSKDGVRRFEGWDNWSKEVEQLFENDPKPQEYDGVVLKYNYSFRIYGNGAWVSCEQMNGGTKTLETRIMEKDKGKWKIAMVQVIFNANEAAPEGSVTNGE